MEDARRHLLANLRDELGDSDVIRAMERIRREEFVPEAVLHLTYEDMALPIGEGQTISQPYIVALMVGALKLQRGDRVLEVGTGSGYQTAILAELCREVVSVERIPSLAEAARRRLEAAGCSNVRVLGASSALGYPNEAPYDAIIVAAAAPKMPRELMDQLARGGRLVIPVGSRESQELTRVSRTTSAFSFETLGACRFVPLIGRDAWPENEAERNGDRP